LLCIPFFEITYFALFLTPTATFHPLIHLHLRPSVFAPK
jgi:hypothetical protein